MNADVEKAVERFDSHFAERASSLSVTAALTSHEWQTIRQALRNQEAEITRLTAERDALLARIEGAMVVKATRNGIVRSEARMNLIGKRVALVVLEDGK